MLTNADECEYSAIYIELYYVFASVWGHQLYSLYGILTLVFVILLVVTCFITIALTYFQVPRPYGSLKAL